MKMAAAILIAAGSIFAVAHFDNPMSTGETIWGTVISIAPTPTGYRSLAATTSANVRLDNGKSIYMEIYGVSAGNRVKFTVRKTKILRRVSYYAVRSP